MTIRDRRSTIEVVAACDDDYAQHLSVMLASLFVHAGTRPVHVSVLVPQHFGQRSPVRAALGSRADAVSFIPVNAGTLAGLQCRADLSEVTYYRLMISELLGADLSRVLFLDCDMLVRGNLGPLWEIDLRGNILGAVMDPGFDHWEVLGLPDRAYFNAGMLLIDLERWRAASIGAQALAFAERHPERLTWGDQCALNWVLRGRWSSLDPIWNVQTPTFGQLRDGFFRPHAQLSEAAAAAHVVHFNAPARPWLYMVDHPFKHEYLAYREQTPWRGLVPPDRYPHNVICKTLDRYAPSLLPVYRSIRRIA